MVPLFHFYLPFMYVLLFTHVTSMRPLPIYRTAQAFHLLYIHHSSCATNTAWSMCCIVTYLNDDTACILLNLNLLDSPLQPGLL